MPSKESKEKDASPQPIDELASRLGSFDGHLRWTIAIAAKVASLHILDGRFQHVVEFTDEEREDMDALQKEQQRLSKMQNDAVQKALKWLSLVCGHLSIDLASLPDNPGPEDIHQLSVPPERAFDVAWELVLLSLGLATAQPVDKAKPPLDYLSSSRALLLRTSTYLKLDTEVPAAEKTIAQILFFQLQATGTKSGSSEMSDVWNAAATAQKDEQSKKSSPWKWAATGAGVVLGGVAIGLTGGLAAPALAPLLAGTMGLTFFGTTGGAVLIGTLLGLGGGGLAGYRTHRRLKGLDDVSFDPIKAEDVPEIPSLTATIVASGFLLEVSDTVEPWRPAFAGTGLDVYSLKADPETFLEGGVSLDKWVRNQAMRAGGTEIIKLTALNALYAGVALPLTIYNGVATALDSDFSRCRDKAQKAGIILAEILEKRVQGNRPCTLIGYGPGATIIYQALLILHQRQLSDLVYSAILISLPDSPSTAKWASVRSVVAHRLVNCYSTNDYVLAIAARLYTLSKSVAGLQAVSAPGIENVDCSDLVGGHLELRKVIASILQRVEHGALADAGKSEK